MMPGGAPMPRVPSFEGPTFDAQTAAQINANHAMGGPLTEQNLNGAVVRLAHADRSDGLISRANRIIRPVPFYSPVI